MFRRAVSRAAAASLRAPSASSLMAAGRAQAQAPAFAFARRAVQLRAKSSLVSILQREVDEEKGNCFEGDELEELHDKINKIFELQEEPGNMEISLVGEVKGDSIRIKFDAQETVDVEEDYEDYDEDEEEESEQAADYDEEEEEGEDELPGIRFVAEVTRDNSGLQFDCVASSNLTIERVRFLNDFTKDTTKENLYFGPNFVDLELDLQEALYKYLAERHIDDELASFITQYSDLKEQREYLSFLENAVKFVKK